ncbi:MAG: DEAD/DEAH box helicase [candidate division KSB1 bacterium]|nr:DEAD/DEAH box helicase [candidate division KSB1 bacterium]
MSTPYHAKYFAHQLAPHHAGDGVRQLTQSLFDACIDLNPHQIEAALFAVQSPLSQGALLADEVGLGKTIEAGLLLCQYWAERRRKLLIICPASLRKQWSLELTEKFHLPNCVLDNRSFHAAVTSGRGNPLDQEQVFIVSIHFAGTYSARLRTIDWDLVVIDEAHKLRNVYKKNNKLAQNIKWALEGRKKILLTATPLQNSLMELYGLAAFIDEHIFGDAESFRQNFVHQEDNREDLRRRLASFCRRTLRNQVTEYIQYTERRSLTIGYEPSDEEQLLYERVSEFIDRDPSYSIPRGQRHLMTLILRKILASSRYAVMETLKSMKHRLEALQADQPVESPLQQFLFDDAIEEEYLEEEELIENGEQAVDPEKLAEEIRELEAIIAAAQQIRSDAKAEALLKALRIGFAELEKMGAARKAIIFTESRRTQHYLAELLRAEGYADKIVLFNGSNDDAESREIYERWVQRNAATGRVSGQRSVDMRTALVEEFRDHAEIMIATEAAAEGINLQFCSLLINYDLPWNPQRIEQRIGRCHRYGQKFDVVVINFLNKRNETDCRVYELLDEKLHLFNGVFGASDEILGVLDSDIDFEQRILTIYQQCRRREEIEAAFAELRAEMESAIAERMSDAKRLLLEHFDYDVHNRIKVNLEETREHLDTVSKRFWQLSKQVLGDIADFDDQAMQFTLKRSPLPQVKTGVYQLVSKSRPPIGDDFLYRLAHPLGEYALAAAKQIVCRPAHLQFDYDSLARKITPLEKLRGRSGWMRISRLVIESIETEEHLVAVGFTDKGKVIDAETLDQLFHLHATIRGSEEPSAKIARTLEGLTEASAATLLKSSAEKNNRYFIDEIEKLDRWSDDVLIVIEKELEEVRRQIRRLSLEARLVKEPIQQHQMQLQLKELEVEKGRLRRELFEREDELLLKRDAIIDSVEKRLHRRHYLEELFTIRWTLV